MALDTCHAPFCQHTDAHVPYTFVWQLQTTRLFLVPLQSLLYHLLDDESDTIYLLNTCARHELHAWRRPWLGIGG